jgi:hypothetical protein
MTVGRRGSAPEHGVGRRVEGRPCSRTSDLLKHTGTRSTRTKGQLKHRRQADEQDDQERKLREHRREDRRPDHGSAQVGQNGTNLGVRAA